MARRGITRALAVSASASNERSCDWGVSWCTCLPRPCVASHFRPSERSAASARFPKPHLSKPKADPANSMPRTCEQRFALCRPGVAFPLHRRVFTTAPPFFHSSVMLAQEGAFSTGSLASRGLLCWNSSLQQATAGAVGTLLHSHSS